jgi:hypothetical protein
MNRILSTVGLFLGLAALVSLIGMFADGANISLWATGFSISIILVLFWAPTYLYLLSRQMEDGAKSEMRTSPALAWLSIIPIAAFAIFLFSVMQIILGGVNTSWINTGIGAFAVAAITTPILIFMRGLHTYQQIPAPEDAAPFVEEEDLPFSLSDLPTAPEDEDELEWPYTDDSDALPSASPDAPEPTLR